MRGAHTVHAVWGNYTAFTPQLDPHKKVLHNNIGTQNTARKWVLPPPPLYKLRQCTELLRSLHPL